VASIASTSNPVQFVPGGLTLTFASCIPISGAGKDVSVSQNPGADSSLATQASGPSPQPSHPTKGYYNRGSTPVTPAQDTKTGQSEARSYESSDGNVSSHEDEPAHHAA
jgi:hypothetical protein